MLIVTVALVCNVWEIATLLYQYNSYCCVTCYATLSGSSDSQDPVCEERGRRSSLVLSFLICTSPSYHNIKHKYLTTHLSNTRCLGPHLALYAYQNWFPILKHAQTLFWPIPLGTGHLRPVRHCLATRPTRVRLRLPLPLTMPIRIVRQGQLFSV